MTGQLSSSATSNHTIIPLPQATDPVEVGHKAAALAALLGAGLPVPDGVVVPARTCSTGDVPDELVAALADTIRSWGGIPVAVRSSGVVEDLPHASYAGLYTTVLDVCGDAALRHAVARTGEGTLILLQSRPVTTLPDGPVPLIPLEVEQPEGFWAREVSHAPLPWSTFTHAVFEARDRGSRQMCTELGFLFETIEWRNIGGWEYVRIVPLGGKEPRAYRAGPPRSPFGSCLRCADASAAASRPSAPTSPAP